MEQSQQKAMAAQTKMQELSTDFSMAQSIQNAKFQAEMAGIKQIDAAMKAMADHMKSKAQDTKTMGQ